MNVLIVEWSKSNLKKNFFIKNIFLEKNVCFVIYELIIYVQ